LGLGSFIILGSTMVTASESLCHPERWRFVILSEAKDLVRALVQGLGLGPAPIRPLSHCVRRSKYCVGFGETCKRLSALQTGIGTNSRHRTRMGVARPPSAGRNS